MKRFTTEAQRHREGRAVPRARSSLRLCASVVIPFGLAACAAGGEVPLGCARVEVAAAYYAQVYGESAIEARERPDGRRVHLWGNEQTGSWTVLIEPPGRPDLRCPIEAGAGLRRRGTST